ncbi:MAG: hypothetical protein AB7Q29_11620 [Vicinamibacterales bacterium]
MTQREFLIRGRLVRLGLEGLADVVLASEMAWEDVKAMAVFAALAIDEAKAGRVPVAAMNALAHDSTVPDAVYHQLYELITLAITDASAQIPPNGRLH